ncbi:MAG: SDR family oxidoreductase [Opitutus sp.]|nr:SDR family oxidoreductase [Opitutus sp.]
MNDELFSVSGQVVLASGASRGIGRALAAGFAARGATLIITGREVVKLEATAKELAKGGATVRAIRCDVADAASIRELVKTVLGEFGHVDTLLNVAGVNKRKKAELFTPEEYDFIIDINLRGMFLLTQEVGRAMLARRKGAVINIDSLNTYAPLKGVLPYAMSKAGVSMMTRGLAMEWGDRNVRVNAIAPGFILTDLNRKLWSEEKMQQWGMANTPLKRLGQVDDLVGTALFLASPASAFMTGQVLYVDGGFSAGLMWPLEV